MEREKERESEKFVLSVQLNDDDDDDDDDDIFHYDNIDIIRWLIINMHTFKIHNPYF